LRSVHIRFIQKLLFIVILCSCSHVDRVKRHPAGDSISYGPFDQAILDVAYVRVLEIYEQYPLRANVTSEGLKGRLKAKWNRFRVTHKSVVSKMKKILMENPELVGVDLFFRVISAAIVNPTLIATGNVHLIPLISPTIFGSEAWVTFLYHLKKWRRNADAKKIFGYSFTELDKFGGELFSIDNYQKVNFHDVYIEGELLKTPIRTESFRDSLSWLFFKRTNDNGLGVHHLENLIGDSDYLRELASYKAIPYYYEEMLIQTILTKKDLEIKTKFFSLIERYSPGVDLEKFREVKKVLFEVQDSLIATDVFLFEKNQNIVKDFNRQFNIKWSFLDKESLQLKGMIFDIRRRFSQEQEAIENLRYQLLAKVKNGERIQSTEMMKKILDINERTSLLKSELDLFHGGLAGLDSKKSLKNLLSEFAHLSSKFTTGGDMSCNQILFRVLSSH